MYTSTPVHSNRLQHIYKREAKNKPDRFVLKGNFLILAVRSHIQRSPQIKHTHSYKLPRQVIL